MKYKQWINEWLSYVKSSSKQRTYERYAQMARVHIVPALGEYELGELSVSDVQRLINELLEAGNARTGKGLSASSISGIICVIKSSLGAAVEAGVMSDCVTDKIRRPKSARKTVECFTVAEQKRIENAIMTQKDKLFGVVLCLYSGLRIGELLALTWADVDLRRGLLTVNKACHDGRVSGKHVRIVDTPKTETSNRVIPLPKQLLPKLRELKKKSTSEFVVSDARRTVFVRSYQKLFEALLKKLNIPHRGFHALRHTFATRAIECGMDVKTLSEILGHKNPSITLGTYTHSLTEHKIAMMNRLGKLL